AQGERTADLWVRDYVECFWKGGLAYTENDTVQDVTFSKAYLFDAGETLESLSINKKRNETEGPNEGQTRWGAIRTKYFIAAMLPEENPAKAGWMESRLDSLYTGEHAPNRLGIGLWLPLEGNSPTTSVRIFAGPLDDTILKRVDPNLTETMSWGWVIFEPFSKAILWGLKHLRQVIPNYGICIIIFSVLIKIIIWPLTRKSYQSMSGMQRIQPKIKELNEKYKKDAQRKQKEMMKLYKEEGINPMGGCLPVLLQMPLLIALFQVFRSTIEFRRAPFVAWINDLSMPDTLFQLPFTIPMYGSHVALLPILMGISTFYQSKSTMSDPNQKMMLYFMPIFMVIIFNNFPSGLTLYYTLFNVWTLIQQKITPPPKPADQQPAK
ncbi:MAG: YidC/Oxa1 family insertase periplasmic-domain containing protein, partial [Candidatus Electryoneaceae bacterium]|nr:YidC/Oxa1 family insertase periplasmic-domain containing protein [Candidatus Electryoneaceae bacterium]